MVDPQTTNFECLPMKNIDEIMREKKAQHELIEWLCDLYKLLPHTTTEDMLKLKKVTEAIANVRN